MSIVSKAQAALGVLLGWIIISLIVAAIGGFIFLLYWLDHVRFVL